VASRRVAAVLMSRSLALAATLLIVVAACAGSPTPSPSPGGSPGPATGFVLRATLSQALPPTSLFARGPLLVITHDLRVLEQGAVPAIFPGPLLPPILERRLSADGWATIADAARAAGLLGSVTDFTGESMAPGSQIAHLQLVVDGVTHELSGDPIIPPCAPPGCVAQPGTRLAFTMFWSQLTGLDGWLAAALGPAQPFQPTSIALLIGPAPQQVPGLGAAPFVWPLASPPSEFGTAWIDGKNRCGIVTGPDLATIWPLLSRATQLTQWVARPSASATFGITPREMLPGDPDPCAAGGALPD
jgi:hypothetical protein